MIRDLIRNDLEEKKLDALFVSDQNNVSYLTEFQGLSPSEREGFVFITKNNLYLLTFSTYFGLFKSKNDITSLCITVKKRLTQHLRDIAEKEKLQKVGFEESSTTVKEFDSLEKNVPVHWIKTDGIVEKYRTIKSPNEISAIKRAAALTDEAFAHIKKSVKMGVSEKELSVEIELYLKKRGADTAFSPIVAFNEAAAIPHSIPSNRKLEKGNLILLDFGAKVDGYCSDMTRVVFFKAPKTEYIKIYNTVKEAQEKALLKMKPGKTGAQVDTIARSYIKSQKYPDYQHGLGHGVGLAIHEAPRLKIGSEDILKKDMVVTVEPGIYIEGFCGVRIEDLVLLKKDGIEILSKSTKEIIIL